MGKTENKRYSVHSAKENGQVKTETQKAYQHRPGFKSPGTKA